MFLKEVNLIEECFRKARITDELCSASITKYRDSINKFFCIVGEKKFEDLKIEDFENFIIEMKNRGAGNSRIANVISAVKWMIGWLQGNGLLAKTLDLEKIRKPKIGRKEPVYLTESEIGMFLGAIEKDIQRSGEIIRNVRFMALVKLLLQTGCRIGEALSINIEKIDWQNKEIPIIGKGGKPRTLSIRDDTANWLKKYLSIRNGNHKALFITLNGESRWRQTDIGRSFRRYRELSGIKKKFTLHSLRRTLATQLFLRGVVPNKVQLVLGHSRLETTVKYYIGAVEKEAVKEIMIKDEYFDFIPKSKL
jgi:integrase/recombinase XerD